MGTAKDGTFYMCNTDLSVIFLVKTRANNKCAFCNEPIPKGSYCLGKNYRWYNAKTCLKCSSMFLNNFMNSLEAIKNQAEKVLKDLHKNERNYNSINSLAKI
jgi:hypothetical protein